MSELEGQGSRSARVVLIVGLALLLVGVFIGLVAQPVTTTDFAYIAGQESTEFPTRLVGGLLLGAGIAIAAALGGYALGRRR